MPGACFSFLLQLMIMAPLASTEQKTMATLINNITPREQRQNSRAALKRTALPRRSGRGFMTKCQSGASAISKHGERSRAPLGDDWASPRDLLCHRTLPKMALAKEPSARPHVPFPRWRSVKAPACCRVVRCQPTHLPDCIATGVSPLQRGGDTQRLTNAEGERTARRREDDGGSTVGKSG